MKKIINKIKNVCAMSRFFLLSAYSKSVVMEVESLYGVEKPKPSPEKKIWEILRYPIIPILLVIGLIIYFKKSKSNKKEKILVAIAIIIPVIIGYFIINKIIYSEI